DTLNIRQRASLLLLDGVVYLAFGSRNEAKFYHGWVVAFEAASLRQIGALNLSPTASKAGVWQASCGLAGDTADGTIYLITGDGPYDAAKRSYGSSFVRIRPNLTRDANGTVTRADLQVVDHFTPFNQAELTRIDLDLGSAGVVLIPKSRELIGGGKEGWIYLIDRHRMGGFDPATDHVIRSFQAAQNTYDPGDPDLSNRRPPQGTDWLKWPHIHGTPIYHTTPGGRSFLYVWPEKDYLKSFERVENRF